MGLRMRGRLAIYGAKLTGWMIGKWKKGGGSALPGYIAHLADPGILAAAAEMVRQRGGTMIVTMGTNGKTTTNSILCRILEAEGKRVIANRTGANMRNGILTALISAFDKNCRPDADFVCLEVDENASSEILPLLQPDCVILTNLFRDQLDRFGEVELTLQRIEKALRSVPQAKLVFNCDDALLCALAQQCENPRKTYGISQPVFDTRARSHIRESRFCPFCGAKLKYDFFHYGQLGIWKCSGCGFKRPKPDYTASEIRFQKGAWSFDLGKVSISSRARAPYSIYNTLAAYGALQALRVSIRRLKETVEAFDYGNNRENRFCIGRCRVQLHLAKNPVGFQQKIALLLKEPGPKDLIIQINDTWQDGRDVSWLWDVDFHHLAEQKSLAEGAPFGAEVSSVTTCGTRRCDMALRLKYEDIPCRTASDLEKAVKGLAARGTGNLYMIVNYSGLYEANALLRKLEAQNLEKDAWEESGLQKGEVLL